MGGRAQREFQVGGDRRGEFAFFTHPFLHPRPAQIWGGGAHFFRGRYGFRNTTLNMTPMDFEGRRGENWVP
jgi:hypothetical protein